MGSVFFFKQKTAYEIMPSLVGSEMCIRDRAGYSVEKDSIAYEKSDSEAAKTYVNVIAVKEGNENNEGIKALISVLKSDEIKKFINEKFNGAVVPFE